MYFLSLHKLFPSVALKANFSSNISPSQEAFLRQQEQEPHEIRAGWHGCHTTQQLLCKLWPHCYHRVTPELGRKSKQMLPGRDLVTFPCSPLTKPASHYYFPGIIFFFSSVFSQPFPEGPLTPCLCCWGERRAMREPCPKKHLKVNNLLKGFLQLFLTVLLAPCHDK